MVGVGHRYYVGKSYFYYFHFFLFKEERIHQQVRQSSRRRLQASGRRRRQIGTCEFAYRSKYIKKLESVTLSIATPALLGRLGRPGLQLSCRSGRAQENIDVLCLIYNKTNKTDLTNTRAGSSVG
jgi:hypothetical protein